MQQLTEKQFAIVDLLRHMRDLEGISASGQGGGDRRDARALYSDDSEWDRSGCDALDTLLAQLRVVRPVQWWHLTERYLRCDVRPVKVKTSKGRVPPLGPQREALGTGIRPADRADELGGGQMLVVVEHWSAKVRLEKVRRALEWTAARYPWNDYRWKDLRQEKVAA